jgi:hypothetical protein
MKAANARVASFVPAFGPDGRIDRTGLEAAVRHGFAVIRWRLDQARP